MARNKVGFHFGSQANATGYGDYIRALDAAGIPAGCMSVGGEGLGDIIACWDQGSTVEHTAVVRYMPPPGHPDGNQDVPRYDMTPEAAFVRFWAWVKPLIGADVRRYSQRIVIKIGNELDKGQSEWLADFYLVGHDIMQSDPDGPFRLGAFGFASGEPEPEHWRGPRMLDYLRLCADDPIGASIVLHEYSYADTLQSGYPFLIGRFQDLFAACDENGIKRPYVYIHEFGHRQDTMPPVNEAMAQLPWAAELYAKFPEIKGAGLWTLQGSGSYGNPHISKLAQPMIEPIKNYTLTAEFPDPPEEPEPPPDGGGGTVTKIDSTVFGGIAGLSDKTVTKIRCQYEINTGSGPNVFGPEFEVPMPPEGTDLRGVRIRAYYEHGRPPIEIGEPTDPNPPPPILTLPAGSKGVDVSFWQGSFNWADSGAEFGIIRCSDGMTANTTTHDGNGIDRQFWANAAKLTALGIPWAIYHFLRPGNTREQADKVLGALSQLSTNGTPPQTAVFDDGRKMPHVWIDVEDSALVPADIEEFYTYIAEHRTVGIYTGKPVWDGIMAGAAVWWADVPLWIAAYGVNDGNVPSWPDGPPLPRGYVEAVFWQYSSNPIDQNIVGPYPPTATQPDPPPPTGKTVDMTQYYLPPNGRTYGDISIKPTNWGQGDVRQQLQLHGGYLFVTKGGEFEKRMILDGRIYFLMDDSPGDGKYYTVNSPTGWIPAQWAVGQTFTRQETTTFYHKANCQPTGEASNWTNVMLFKALYGEWVSPYGLKLVNVAHLQWLVNGVVEENYWLGKNLGYVGWSNKHGRESWIKEIIPYTDQEPNKFAGSCYHPAFG